MLCVIGGPNPGGNGGTGGGVGAGCGCGCCCIGCLFLTGGSVAKTSRRMDKRSTIVDLYNSMVST